MFAAVVGWIFLVDFPDVAVNKNHWRFLKREEIEFILRRINKDRHDSATEKWNFRKWAAGGGDWKIWVFALQFCCLTTQAYSLAYFLPIILRANMGFSVGESQMLTAPPYAGAAIVMFICAWFGDKYHVRGPLLLFNAALGLTGVPLLVSDLV